MTWHPMWTIVGGHGDRRRSENKQFPSFYLARGCIGSSLMSTVKMPTGVLVRYDQMAFQTIYQEITWMIHAKRKFKDRLGLHLCVNNENQLHCLMLMFSCLFISESPLPHASRDTPCSCIQAHQNYELLLLFSVGHKSEEYVMICHLVHGSCEKIK